MDRRAFLGVCAGGLVVGRSFADAQPAVKVYRIGFLGIPSAAQYASRLAAFRAGLSDLGYVEGKNIVIELRWADGNNSRLPELAAELVRLNVDVIVTHAAGALAARQATTTIPIVMAVGGDAVAMRLAISLARPGGNVTGSTILIPELNVKRLELLKTAVPRIGRVALLVHEGSPANEPMLRFMEGTAKSLNLTLQTFAASAPDGFDAAFSKMASAGVDAVVVFEEPMFVFTAGAVAELAAKRRMPLAGFTRSPKPVA